MYKKQRINEEVLRELTRIVRTVKDPRVGNYLTSITGCEVSADLKYAKVYYTFLSKPDTETSDEARANIKKGLVSAHGYIRHELAVSLNMRQTPSLTFIPDKSAEYGAGISKILKEINEEKS